MRRKRKGKAHLKRRTTVSCRESKGDMKKEGRHEGRWKVLEKPVQRQFLLGFASGGGKNQRLPAKKKRPRSHKAARHRRGGGVTDFWKEKEAYYLEGEGGERSTASRDLASVVRQLAGKKWDGESSTHHKKKKL